VRHTFALNVGLADVHETTGGKAAVALLIAGGVLVELAMCEDFSGGRILTRCC
jgi:hypothetical protein